MRFFHVIGLVTTAVVLLSAAPVLGEALEQAATDLGEGRINAARDGFQSVAKDAAQPAYARSLAWLGLAEAALARGDAAAAIAAWQQLAADATLPSVYRDSARRQMAMTERRQKGLPERDPTLYRASLPALPEPALVFHVVPAATEAGDGSEAKPFLTLLQARDAVRAIKKQHGGKLPKGGGRGEPAAVAVAPGTSLLRTEIAAAAGGSGRDSWWRTYDESPSLFRSGLSVNGQTAIGSRILVWLP